MKKAVLILAIAALFSSCLDEDTTTQYVSDMFLVSKVIDGDTLFAIDGTLYSDNKIDSVRGEGVYYKGFNHAFTKLDDAGFFFEYRTPDLLYQKNIPAASEYNMTAYHTDGTKKTLTDEVSTLAIAPAVIDSFGYDRFEKKIYLDWTKVNNAEYYSVRISNTKGEIIFNSSNLIYQTQTYSIDEFTQGWYNNTLPNYGDTLSLCVIGLLFEENASVSYNNNYQAISFSETQEVVWGKE